MNRTLSLLGVALALAASAPAQKTVKVFVLAGQSNMQGHGRISLGKDGDLDFTAQQERFAWLKDGDDWRERDDVWYFHKNGKGEITKGNLRVGLGANANSIGPELAFGHAMGELFDEPVLIIKTAWGGQALAQTFRPPSAGMPAQAVLDQMFAKANGIKKKQKPDPNMKPKVSMEEVKGRFGSKYRQMLEEVDMVVSNVGKHFPKARGRKCEIVGFFWHQGWNDGCNKAFADEYETNMKHFIADVRKDLGDPKLPFVIATSGMGGPGAKGVAGFLAKGIEPKQVAAAESAKLCTAVPTRQFQLHQPGRQKSHWFNSAESYCLVGDSAAQAMAALLEAR